MKLFNQGYININDSLISVVIYGLVNSRRLGNSLGINLFSNEIKGCNFDCVYCQYGRTLFSKNSFLNIKIIKSEITKYFNKIASENILIDFITLAGNGEPTLHPNFPEIIDFILLKRNEFLPNIPISVFTNATLLHKSEIKDTLKKVNRIFVKLDSSDHNSFLRLGGKGNYEKIIENIIQASNELNIEISTAVISSPEHYSNYKQLKSSKFVEIINKIKTQKLILYSINKVPAEIEIQRIPETELLELKSYLKKKINVPIELLK